MTRLLLLVTARLGMLDDLAGIGVHSVPTEGVNDSPHACYLPSEGWGRAANTAIGLATQCIAPGWGVYAAHGHEERPRKGVNYAL